MWKESYPRLHELYSLSETSHPDNYFNHFETRLKIPLAEKNFQTLEADLEKLNPMAWNRLLKKSLRYVTIRDIKNERHYSQLFDHLNEAKGYLYLQNEGYTHIEFIDATTTAPDLFAARQNETTLLEVKTINRSSSDNFYVAQPFPKDTRNVRHGLPEDFQNKLISTIDNARNQLLSYQPKSSHRRICCLIVIFDTDMRLAQINYDELASFISRHSDNKVEVIYVNH